MVDSRTPETAEPSTPTADVPPRVGVAYSGGRDSTALLWACLKAARPLGVEVLACHVHHGLLPQADDWWVQAQDRCDAWAAQGWPVRFCGVRLSDAPTPGESVEAWARQARYAALQALAQREGLSLMLLGHHQQDQAETVLIQLLRGAGPAGLAAMPASREGPGGLIWARPWLDVAPAQIQVYAESQGLQSVQDPSNLDVRFARNRIRHLVLPALVEAFPTALADLSLSAGAQAEALAVISEVAADDLERCRRLEDPYRLDARALGGMTPSRRRLVLRAWGRSLPCRHLPESLLDRLIKDLHLNGQGGRRWPAPRGSELRLHGVDLAWFPAPMEEVRSSSGAAAAEDKSTPVNLSAPGDHRLPGWRGVMQVSCMGDLSPRSCTSKGEHRLPAAMLAEVTVRTRKGSDRFQRHASGLPRSLKKCFQEEGVPAWDREVPVLVLAGGLLFVPGLGCDARLHPTRDLPWPDPFDPGWRQLDWVPDRVQRCDAPSSMATELGSPSGSP